MPSDRASKLKVLCFGDSLTQGFCDFGLTSHPYAITLQKRLSEAFPDDGPLVVANGVPGDIVTGPAFKRRLMNACQMKEWDWVILLAGTNDLGSYSSVEQIREALRDSWDVPLLKGMRVLALTVPEVHVKVNWLQENRAEVNEFIMGYKQKNYHCFDLMSKIPFHSLPDDDVKKYWDDGIHLTTQGYDWMGNHIADALIPLLQEEAKNPKPSAARRISRRPGDDAALTEEVGSPRHISQGYIVVRKKDLD